MAFDNLQEKLTKTLRNLQGKGKLSEKNMESTLKEIRVALLEADVNYAVVKNFLEDVRNKAIGQDVLNEIEPGQALIKIVHDELINLLGHDEPLNINDNGQTIIMMVGLQGTGKTTQAAKIAKYIKERLNKKVLLVAADLLRPAAVEQLKILGNSIGVDVFCRENSNTEDLLNKALAFSKNNNYDVVIIDTAGRLQVDNELMQELTELKKIASPQEILLTVDALTGQDIVNVAGEFNKKLDITGLVVTKYDSDAKGGAILSVRSVTNVPIKFVGTGEKTDDLEAFHPERLADRILGMGDVVSLVEKAQEKIDMKQAEEDATRLLSGKFSMDDLLKQIEQTSKLGPISGILKMMPGQFSDMAKMIDDDQANKQITKTKAMIQSMTKEERENPDIISTGRKKRIAQGAGVSFSDVNRLLNQYEKMRKMMKQFSSMKNMFGL